MSQPEIALHFDGPFSWFAGPMPCVLDAESARGSGIYLWTVPTQADGELIYYVGETGRSFSHRFAEHLREQLSGWYRLYDPTAMVESRKRLLWRGRYGPDAEPSVEGFVENLEVLAPFLRKFTTLVRFYLGSMNTDARLRRRVEAAIADHLYAQDEPVGGFQDLGIRYDRRRPDESPGHVNITASSALRGLPEVVDA